MRTIRQRSYLRSFLVFAVAISSISSVGAPDDLLSKEGLDNWLCTALSTPDLENRLATLPSTDSEQVESTLLQGKFVDMQTWRVRSASVNIEYIKYTTKSTGKWHWVLAIRFREPIFASEQDIRAWLGSLAQSSIRKSQGDNPPYVEYIAGDPSPIRKAGHGEDSSDVFT